MEAKNKVVYCTCPTQPVFRKNDFPLLDGEEYGTLWFYQDEQCSKHANPSYGQCLSVTCVRKRRDGIVWKVVYKPNNK